MHVRLMERIENKQRQTQKKMQKTLRQCLKATAFCYREKEKEKEKKKKKKTIFHFDFQKTISSLNMSPRVMMLYTILL